MQESLYQTADVGDTLSDSRCKKSFHQTADVGVSLSDSGCRRHFIRQRMQKSPYQTADAGDTLSDSGCKSLSIRQQMKETLYQTTDDTLSARRVSLYQTVVSRMQSIRQTLHGRRRRSINIRHSISQRMQEPLYQTTDAGDTLSAADAGVSLSDRGCK